MKEKLTKVLKYLENAKYEDPKYNGYYTLLYLVEIFGKNTIAFLIGVVLKDCKNAFKKDNEGNIRKIDSEVVIMVLDTYLK